MLGKCLQMFANLHKRRVEQKRRDVDLRDWC